MKKMFGFTGHNSMTGLFLDLWLPTFDTVVRNSRVFFYFLFLFIYFFKPLVLNS